MDGIIIIAIGVAGFLGGYIFRNTLTRIHLQTKELELEKRQIAVEEKALKIVETADAEARNIEREQVLRAREREEKLNKTEERLIKKEELLDTRQIDLDSNIENVRAKIEEIRTLRGVLDERARTIDAKIEEVAGMTQDEAYARIVSRIESERESDLVARIQKIETQGAAQFEERAKHILATAVQRIGNIPRPDLVTATIELASDELKGKIIGREGRNIRAFEYVTGVDVLVDEVPGTVTLSSFDPVRREIARVAMGTLLESGRIQPAKIEEVVEKSRKQVAEIVREKGQKACYDTGVTGLHTDLMNILGRLYFRTSYGQNVLAHSIETAHIAAMLAEEIGANVNVAKTAGLLHDVGKALSHDTQGTHVDIGIRILKKYEVSDEAVVAMRSHHEEYPYESVEALIVQVADSLSASRPGARRDSLEAYIKRISEIEHIAQDREGVARAFAVQAGREVRVFVDPEKVNDVKTRIIARDIAVDIEKKIKYPGEIKVHVVREMGVVTYAR